MGARGRTPSSGIVDGDVVPPAGFWVENLHAFSGRHRLDRGGRDRAHSAGPDLDRRQVLRYIHETLAHHGGADSDDIDVGGRRETIIREFRKDDLGPDR